MQRGDNQQKVNSNVPAAEFANDDQVYEALSHLDVIREPNQFGEGVLSGKSIAVIGAGPAGLVFARCAAAEGATVVVLEEACDPRTIENSEYTDRSFNITLESVGRHVLNDKRAWQGGIWLKGRAIHNYLGTQKIHYAPYGETRETELISIPRPLFRKNLINHALEAGAEIRLQSRVTEIDVDSGNLVYVDVKSNKNYLRSDLVVICDGLHSLGDSLLKRKYGDNQIHLREEPYNYVAALLYPNDKHNLSLQHIHFWHEHGKEAYTIGIPSGDGTIALLLNSTYTDFAADEYPFKTEEQAQRLLKRDFQQLYELAGPQLARQLPRRIRGSFKFKSVERYRIGEKAVIVGDAGCTFPPWAGFGANSAMYGASSLVYQLAAHGDDVQAALEIYQAQQLIISRQITKFVDDHGKFFTGDITKKPDTRPDGTVMGLLIKQAQIKAKEIVPAVNESQKVKDQKYAKAEI